MKILGVSASLRNRRFAYKNELVEDIKKVQSLEGIKSFVNDQIKITFEEIKNLNKGLSFDQNYKKLKKFKGNRGLSNSEASLVYALWQANSNGVDIDYLSLSNIFENENKSKLSFFKKKFLECDALLISGPVYFGDRGSLTQRMIEFINSDKKCINHIKKIFYAGLAVGAKRNGGQETTLIFQMTDFLNMGAKVVGNGHDTTSQYGGTLVAGDIGKVQDDDYGIRTSLSTGDNLSKCLKDFKESIKVNKDEKIDKKSETKICNVFVMQDNEEEECTKIISSFIKNNKKTNVKFNIFKVFKEKVYRCIACDLCPTSYGNKEDYRCIINNKDDFFKLYHNEIINCDSFIFAAYSGENYFNIQSNYQQFIERTRYLRRDDYAMGSKLVTSFIVSEVNSNRNLHIRTLTSLIRHKNILSKPLLVFKNQNSYINIDSVKREFKNFINNIEYLKSRKEENTYVPIGYEISYKGFLKR